MPPYRPPHLPKNIWEKVKKYNHVDVKLNHHDGDDDDTPTTLKHFQNAGKKGFIGST